MNQMKEHVEIIDKSEYFMDKQLSNKTNNNNIKLGVVKLI
jgi:hypothetical protein